MPFSRFNVSGGDFTPVPRVRSGPTGAALIPGRPTAPTPVRGVARNPGGGGLGLGGPAVPPMPLGGPGGVRGAVGTQMIPGAHPFGGPPGLGGISRMIPGTGSGGLDGPAAAYQALAGPDGVLGGVGPVPGAPGVGIGRMVGGTREDLARIMGSQAPPAAGVALLDRIGWRERMLGLAGIGGIRGVYGEPRAPDPWGIGARAAGW